MNDEVLVKKFSFNNNNYYVINEIDYNNHHYVYLTNEKDKEDIMIRRVKGNIIEPLDSEEELLEVLKLFIK